MRRGESNPLPMTEEQWAEAETERQRQAEWCRPSSTRYGDWERNSTHISRRSKRQRAERFPFRDVPDDADATPQADPAGRSIIDTRIGQPPVF